MNLEELMELSIDQLKNTTKLRSFSKGSIARGILEIYNENAVEIHTTLDLQILNAYISTATGEKLDEIGKLVGIERYDYTYAVGPLKFYLDPLEGQSIDDLLDIMEEKTGVKPVSLVLPAGTEITNDNGTVIYNTISDVIFNTNEVYVDVLSSIPGIAGKVGSDVLTKISSLPPDYSYISTYIHVTNPLPIDNADDKESDDNFRYKIVNQVALNAGANRTALKLAALSVSGVADILLKPYEYGVGTTGLFVISESPIVSTGLINAVQQVVTNVMSSSEEVIVTSPDYTAIELQVVLEFQGGILISDKDAICQQTKSNVIDYINNIKVGGEFIINEIIQRILETSPKIYDLKIRKMGLGDYNANTGLIDYYKEVLPVNQPIDELSKFVSNTKLISVCYE